VCPRRRALTSAAPAIFAIRRATDVRTSTIGRAADTQVSGAAVASRTMTASRLKPPLVDVLIAAALVLAAELEAAFEPVSVARWVDGLVVLGFTVPLAWRRRAPLVVLAIAAVTVVVYGEVEDAGSHQTLILAIALASFTAGYELPPRRAWIAPAIIVVADLFAIAVLGQDGGDFVFVMVIYVGPWVLAQALRGRGERVDELTARTDALESERAQREAAAVEAERARIARELHDVVSHSISVIAVQSQAIRRRLGAEHEREAADLAGVETTARQAMAEMRRLLGVLRSDGERLPLAPNPGLGQLPRLVEQVRGSGLEVDVAVVGEPLALPPGVDLAAYRIVQEALTNAIKHARTRRATVEIRYDAGTIALVVSDDGAGPAANGNGGHGLLGMRERVTLYGGTLQAGPGDSGRGFRVRAVLPVQGGVPT
jgi:signal transduction histidine kinase